MDLSFIGRQFRHLPYPATPFEGQTVIVTGSNIGLGLEAARHFTRLNASKVILACRSLPKGEAAAKSIAESTGRDGVVEVWQVDMSNFDSIKEFVKRAAKLDRLDVVCENAGIATGDYRQSDGFEQTIAVNVVGTFLLALNLLPILRKSGMKYGFVPRLVITSSEVHAWAKFDERNSDSIFEALNENNKKYMADRYQTSKLLEVFAIRELASKMSSGPNAREPVILNCLNPGLCHSALTREVTGIRSLIFTIFKLILARTTEVGSRTIVASASAGEESHGKYMSDCVVTEPTGLAKGPDAKKLQERVWGELSAVLEKIQPGILKNI